MFEKSDDWLEWRGISRRTFLQYCAGMAALIGLSPGEVVHALESATQKPPVLWLSGQDCAGCIVSFAGLLNPPVASVILDKISLRYQEAIMAASGYLAEAAYHKTLEEGGYILILEGAVPGADDRFCMIGGRPFKELVQEAAKKAAFIIAVGACASFGGIPRGTPTKGMPVSEILPGKKIVKISSCPPHRDHMIGTILYLLATGKIPDLDEHGRPLMYFGPNIHDNCRRRSHFDNEEYLTDWNDPAQRNWCLYEKGCKGPDTNADMPIRRWNDGINFCIDCGSPCQGCAEPTFYDGNTPLYTAESEQSRNIMARKRAGLIPRKETA
jgi:hydrogenase small subunit